MKKIFLLLFVLSLLNAQFVLNLMEDKNASSCVAGGQCTCVVMFYSPTCEYCLKVDAHLQELMESNSIQIVKYNVQEEDNLELKEAFDDYYGIPQKRRAGVPALYVGSHYFLGADEAIKGMEDVLREYEYDGVGCPNVTLANADARIRGRFEEFSPLAVILAALIDSINPCAFAGIVFFISYLTFTGRKGRTILIVGLTYAFGVFLAYMLMGIGILRFVAFAEQASLISRIIYPLTGFIALIFSIVSFQDYLKARKGKINEMALQLPLWAKRITRKTTRELASLQFISFFAFVIGFLISLFEFLCTGQVYLPTIVYIMGVETLRAQALLYLFLYNLIFVAPLVVIFAVAYAGTSSKAIGEYFSARIKYVKLATSVFFFIMGIALIMMAYGFY